MARNRRKKALYEVISKSWPRPGAGRKAERLRPPVAEKKPQPTEPKASVPGPATASPWPKRPRLVQFSADRVELSLPYQVAIAVLLAIILVALVLYRLGQMSAPGRAQPTGPAKNVPAKAPPGQLIKPAPTENETTSDTAEENVATEQQRDHVIVVQQYDTRADLVPVQKHFADYDIETEIVLMNGVYFLITKDRYEDTETTGTEGYQAKLMIRNVGALYRAPAGHERFARRKFSDAYGMKITE